MRMPCTPLAIMCACAAYRMMLQWPGSPPLTCFNSFKPHLTPVRPGSTFGRARPDGGDPHPVSWPSCDPLASGSRATSLTAGGPYWDHVIPREAMLPHCACVNPCTPTHACSRDPRLHATGGTPLVSGGCFGALISVGRPPKVWLPWRTLPPQTIGGIYIVFRTR